MKRENIRKPRFSSIFHKTPNWLGIYLFSGLSHDWRSKKGYTFLSRVHRNYTGHHDLLCLFDDWYPCVWICFLSAAIYIIFPVLHGHYTNYKTLENAAACYILSERPLHCFSCMVACDGRWQYQEIPKLYTQHIFPCIQFFFLRLKYNCYTINPRGGEEVIKKVVFYMDMDIENTTRHKRVKAGETVTSLYVSKGAYIRFTRTKEKS